MRKAIRKLAILAVTFVCLAVLVLVAIPAAIYFSSDFSFEKLTGAGGTEDGTVTFNDGVFPRFSPEDIGEELSGEQFVALMRDKTSTKLIQQTFRKSASGARVNWLLLLDDVSQVDDDTLEGQFTLPYELVKETPSGTSTEGSQIPVSCRFTEESRSDLLRLRQGDWVRVRGQIYFDNDSVTIEEAQVGPPPEA